MFIAFITPASLWDDVSDLILKGIDTDPELLKKPILVEFPTVRPKEGKASNLDDEDPESPPAVNTKMASSEIILGLADTPQIQQLQESLEPSMSF